MKVKARITVLLGSGVSLKTALLAGTLFLLLAVLVLRLPWHASVDVGGLYDHPYLRQFYPAEYSREHRLDFRWSRPDAALVLPGAGRLAPLTLRLHGDESGTPVLLDAGSGPVEVTLRHGWQHISLLPRQHAWSGDVLVNISAPPQPQHNADDERERGVVLDRIDVQGVPGTFPPGQAVLIGGSVVLAVVLAGWAFRRAWVGVAAGCALGTGCLVVLGWHGGAWRLMLTDYTGRLVLVLASGGVVAWGIRRVLALLAQRGILTLARPLQHHLAAIALLAFLLRFGGMAYPLNFISDIRFTMARATMVREGELLKLFLPNPSLTPLQWETEATIPRSPFYYILASPLTALPGNADRLAVMGLSSAIDALAVVLVGVIVCYAGGSSWAAALAAVLAAALPFGLELVMSWGLFPTLLAQCLVLLAMVVWLRLRPHLHRRGAVALLTAAFVLAYLAYPTALLFLATTWLILVLLLALRRDSASIPTLVAGVGAALLALLLFYGWHIPSMFTETLPVLVGRLSQSDPVRGDINLAGLTDPLWKPLLARYGVLVMVLALSGGVLIGAGRASAATRYAHLLLLAWVLTYPPMALMSEHIVTFILKDVLYMLPAIAVLCGLFLGKLARYRGGRAVAAVILALVVWEGVRLELHAIAYAFYQLK
jgi:hypothetical protein